MTGKTTDLLRLLLLVVVVVVAHIAVGGTIRCPGQLRRFRPDRLHAPGVLRVRGGKQPVLFARPDGRHDLPCECSRTYTATFSFFFRRISILFSLQY